MSYLTMLNILAIRQLYILLLLRTITAFAAVVHSYEVCLLFVSLFPHTFNICGKTESTIVDSLSVRPSVFHATGTQSLAASQTIKTPKLKLRMSKCFNNRVSKLQLPQFGATISITTIHISLATNGFCFWSFFRCRSTGGNPTTQSMEQ